MRRTSHVFLVGILFACLTGHGQAPDDFLEHQSVASIAVLPPVGATVPDSARQLAAELFATKLRLRKSAVQLVPPSEVLARLQQKAAVGDYGTFVNLFAQTGMTDPEAVKRIASATGTDSVMFIDVLNYTEQKGSWWYGKGGQNICRIQYTLFRSSSGEKVWESLEFRQHDSKVSTNPYPMERVIGDVTDKAVASLLAGKQNVDIRQKTLH